MRERGRGAGGAAADDADGAGALDTFRGEANLSTWLFTLARSACSRIHRKSRSVPMHDVALDADGADTVLVEHADEPDQRTEAAEMEKPVASAIKALPTTYREVVALRDVEGLPAEEAAAVLGIEAHLEACADCAEALGDRRDAAALCRRLPQGRVPEPVHRAMRAAIAVAFPPVPRARPTFEGE